MRFQRLRTAIQRRTFCCQFSLRTLLVFICVFCIWIGRLSENAREQRLATQSILRERGLVKYDYQLRGASVPPGPAWLRRCLGDDYFCTVVAVTFDFQPWTVTDAGLQYICRLPHVRSLDLQGTRVTDAGLAKLKGLANLRSLNLERTQITGPGLMHLSGLRRLEWLSLRGCRVKSCGAALSGLTELRHLDLTNTHLGDDDVEFLAALRNLNWLSLAGTEISDAGLRVIDEATDLQWLSVAGTHVTDDGLRSLWKLKRLTYVDTAITSITKPAKGQLRKKIPGLTTLP